MSDSEEKRELAAQQRDNSLAGVGAGDPDYDKKMQGLAGVSPADPDYDKKMQDTFGGPPPKWCDKARPWLAKRHCVEGKVALVTGGSGGIGFYIVKLLAHCGFTVIVPARPGFEKDTEAAVEAVKRDVTGAKLLVPAATLDLASFKSVREFSASLCKEQNHLDLLCLNAGRGGGEGNPCELTMDRHEAIMQVNILSHFLLTHELLWMLRAAPGGGRIVSQSSGARFTANVRSVDDIDGTNSDNFSSRAQYCLSKACCVLFTLALNERLVEAGVNNVIACVSDPGLSATGLVRSEGLVQMFDNTNQFHDAHAHHAADGALPMALASVDPSAGRNTLYTTDGIRASALTEAAHRHDPTKPRESKPHEMPSRDPMNEAMWPRRTRESFWEQAAAMTGASWDGLQELRQSSKPTGNSNGHSVYSSGKHWVVEAATCVARFCEELQSPLVGRYAKGAILEQLEQQGMRLHVKLVEGAGPGEGWVSIKLTGKDVLRPLFTEI